MSKLANVMAGIKGTTKAMVGAIVMMGGAMQLDVVKNFITPLLANHPKASSAVLTFTALGLVLSNPKVQHALHLDDVEVNVTTTTTTETTATVEEKK